MKIPATGDLHGRAIEEWIGKTPDEAIPDRVAIRVHARFKGRDALTGERLIPGCWHCDHIVPLWKGGEHRESNLQPLAIRTHKEKTAAEADERAISDRKRAKYLLPKKSAWNRKFTPNVKQLEDL